MEWSFSQLLENQTANQSFKRTEFRSGRGFRPFISIVNQRELIAFINGNTMRENVTLISKSKLLEKIIS